MWTRIINLLRAARRPLVVFDFETSGLGGAPPVEYAVAYWAPWAPDEMDVTTVAARRVCPPGLTYATTMRLDPGRPIDPGALAAHGITAEMLKGCPRFNDMEVVAFFQGLAQGTGDERPAIWCGHNVAEADIPWAQRWGYLPSSDLPMVDTMRLTRRLARSHPMPLTPDLMPAGSHCPAVRHGLKPYATSLEGVHTALYGDPPEQSHAAMADVCATANVLAGLVSLWEPLWPGAVVDEDPVAALDALVAELGAPPAGQISWDGWLRAPLDGSYVWGAKAKKVGDGAPLTVDRGFARWVAALPSSPTGVDGQAWCSPETRAVLLAAVG